MSCPTSKPTPPTAAGSTRSARSCRTPAIPRRRSSWRPAARGRGRSWPAASRSEGLGRGVVVSTPNSAKLGLGVTAFLAFVGVVVPVLANVLNPTLLLNALVAIALGAATAIVQRTLARRSQRRALAGALRLWPPTRVA